MSYEGKPADYQIARIDSLRRELGDATKDFEQLLANNLPKRNDALRDQLTTGEYVGWLASAKDAPDKIIVGAGVQLRHVLPHPLTSPNGDAVIAERSPRHHSECLH